MVQLFFTSHAGVQHVAPIEQFPDDKWEQVIAVNLSAAFHTMKLAVPGMKERGVLKYQNKTAKLRVAKRKTII